MEESIKDNGQPLTHEECKQFATSKLIKLFGRNSELTPEDEKNLELVVEAIVEASTLSIAASLSQFAQKRTETH